MNTASLCARDRLLKPLSIDDNFTKFITLKSYIWARLKSRHKHAIMQCHKNITGVPAFCALPAPRGSTLQLRIVAVQRV